MADIVPEDLTQEELDALRGASKMLDEVIERRDSWHL